MGIIYTCAFVIKSSLLSKDVGSQYRAKNTLTIRGVDFVATLHLVCVYMDRCLFTLWWLPMCFTAQPRLGAMGPLLLVPLHRNAAPHVGAIGLTTRVDMLNGRN